MRIYAMLLKAQSIWKITRLLLLSISIRNEKAYRFVGGLE